MSNSDILPGLVNSLDEENAELNDKLIRAVKLVNFHVIRKTIKKCFSFGHFPKGGYIFEFGLYKSYLTVVQTGPIQKLPHGCPK